jgi:hypothetical protein
MLPARACAIPTSASTAPIPMVVVATMRKGIVAASEVTPAKSAANARKISRKRHVASGLIDREWRTEPVAEPSA